MQLPHKLDRPYQEQTARQIVQSPQKFIIINACTGSGKTAYAAYAASVGLKVLAVVRTKSLQRQYEIGYGFTSITGKADYHCNGYGQQKDFFNDYSLSLTADLCTVPKDYKRLCRDNCPYPRARHKFINSQAGILNYAKFLSDRKLIEDFNPDIIFLDESHELSESIVTDFSGTTFSWKDKKLRQYTQPVTILKPQPLAIPEGREWLQSLYWSLNSNEPQHPNKGGDLRFYKWWQRKKEKVDITLAAMDIISDCWFVEADDKGFLCKPLTSQFHFLPLFDKAPKIVLMSATIQREDINSLGVIDYDFIKVPNTIAPAMRPVYDLGGPKVTAKMTYQEEKEHAQIVAGIFKKYPSWNGIIHVTSESMAWKLKELMKLPNPVWIPEKSSVNGKGTDKQYQDWQEFNNRYENAICISWQFFAGADMADVAINICARVPYPYFGDEYEKARFNYSPAQARVRVANTMEQQMGRNRRGFAEHYGPGAKKYNAIVDGKWSRLKSAMQKDFLRSIVK